MKPYNVLLYYYYTPIKDPLTFRQAHYSYCVANNLLGRIIIAKEGINGTVSGLREDCEKYMNYLKQELGASDIDFKVDKHSTHTFKKLYVRVKGEIVNAGLPTLDPSKQGGTYISPTLFKKMKEEKDVVIVDLRSRREYGLGRFKDSVGIDMDYLRELPKKAGILQSLQGKRIITVCTGGVKCEKGSALLLQKGLKNVFQLHGGIIKYGMQTDGRDFEGTCYVFDNRLTVPINKYNPSVVSKCHACNTPCERIVNCALPRCNNHVSLCVNCGERLQGACSTKCQKDPKKRPYNGTGYYTKKLNGYDIHAGLKNFPKPSF